MKRYLRYIAELIFLSVMFLGSFYAYAGDLGDAYVVTIPTTIKYENMGVGRVDTRDRFSITVSNNPHATVTVQGDSCDLTGAAGQIHAESSSSKKALIFAPTGESASQADTITMTGQAKRIGLYTGNISYTCSHKVSTYTIRFNANGGVGTMADQTMEFYIKDYINGNQFTRTGYTFKEWNTKPDGSGTSFADHEVVGDLTDVNGAVITLYAQWNQYTITYTLNGGVNSPANPTTYNSATPDITLITPTKTGYTFTGWTGSNGSSPQTSVVIPKGSTGNKNYSANWQANGYTIRFNANGGTGNMADEAMTYDSEKALTTNAYTMENYSFLGWATSSNGEVVYSDKQVVKNLTDKSGEIITLYAVWYRSGYPYPKTGGVQKFVVPEDGLYKLEVWGAQGGSGGALQAPGGYGAYATGQVLLPKGTVLYIYSGGKGGANNGSTGGAGGYNGGGKGGQGNQYKGGGGGGGATHISLQNGLLSTLSNARDKILIVAGGGGGGTCGGDERDYYYAGAGGGFCGGSSRKKTEYGLISEGASQIKGYAFGQGQNGVASTLASMGAEGNGGGGGGYFGGFSSQKTGESTNAAGGGGSGYIGNPILYKKHMTAYQGQTSNAEDTKTQSTDNHSESPITDYAKGGDGYAKITFLQKSAYFYYGAEQTWTAPADGTYKIEVWGAQGGTGGAQNTKGGYGGYATGLIHLAKDEILYINVGGAGGRNSGPIGGAGGYNGGGKGGNGYGGYLGGGGGGGCTSIAKKSGQLSKLSGDLSSIIIVAGGGGGGASGASTPDNYISGSGGGVNGAPGQKKTTAGLTSDGSTQTSGYAFGQGQNGVNSPAFYSCGAEGNGAGGGGFYGGCSNQFTGTNSNAAGGGGSGYIGNPRLYDKHMAAYAGTTSDDATTKTIRTSRYFAYPAADCAKEGNGSASIILVTPSSSAKQAVFDSNGGTIQWDDGN